MKCHISYLEIYTYITCYLSSYQTTPELLNLCSTEVVLEIELSDLIMKFK